MQRLTIVTRTSPLAMWQTGFVRDKLKQHYPDLDIHILGVKTTGDKWLETPLYRIGGKSLFVKELEVALLEGAADIAVHSLKDVPAMFPEGLGLAALCQRESALDAWICPKGVSVESLPSGSRVGTSSLRRIVQLQQIRKDLHYAPLRGNVNSRLAKCLKGEWDAIVLAEAGVKRLNLMSHVTKVFSSKELLPAVGQGVLAIECRLDDKKTQKWVSVLDHAPTRVCITAERAMNAALGGNCQVAVAGLAKIVGEKLHLTGRVGDPESALLLEYESVGELTDPVGLGLKVAHALIEQGANDIVKRTVRGSSQL